MKVYRKAGRRARKPCSSNSSGSGITVKQTIMAINKNNCSKDISLANISVWCNTHTWHMRHILLLRLKAVQNGHQPWPDAVRCQRCVILTVSNTSKSSWENKKQNKKNRHDVQWWVLLLGLCRLWIKETKYLPNTNIKMLNLLNYWKQAFVLKLKWNLHLQMTFSHMVEKNRKPFLLLSLVHGTFIKHTGSKPQPVQRHFDGRKRALPHDLLSVLIE